MYVKCCVVMYHTETYIFHVNNYRMFITNMATVRKFELIWKILTKLKYLLA
jgi:hypothetical protein